MTATEFYGNLVSAIQAKKECEKNNNSEWFEKWSNKIEEMVSELPHGSGIDGTNRIEEDRCRSNKLVISIEFHHMDENGYYDGWTEHNVIITPTFSGIDVQITGRDRNQIKDYLGDVFACFTPFGDY